MIDFHLGTVGHQERALNGIQTKNPGARDRVFIGPDGDMLIDGQGFFKHMLATRSRRLQVENKIGVRKVDVVSQVDGE